MVVAGIDPGMRGAIAVIGEGIGVMRVLDTPMMPDKRTYNICDMSSISHWISYNTDFVSIEVQYSMYGSSHNSAFKTGYGYGIWIASLEAYGNRVHTVHSSVWKSKLGLIGKEKSSSVEMANSLYGTGKIRHDRAEAILLAHYLMEEKKNERTTV